MYIRPSNVTYFVFSLMLRNSLFKYTLILYLRVKAQLYILKIQLKRQ